MKHLLEVRNLVTKFYADHGVVNAVNGISYTLDAGESLAIVGESGSGKSVSVLSIMGLIPDPPGSVESGEVLLNGRNLFALSESHLRRIRGREMAMVFQDPMTCLNPVLTVGRQISETIRPHLNVTRREAKQSAVEMLELVGIPDASQRFRDYPHQFSGGQQQRIMIALALSCKPAVLIADEPTTALDVTIQAQIVDLLKQLQKELSMAVIWITHDLALVAGLVDKVVVMYAGYLVEQAPVREIFRTPLHPYTAGLLKSMPRVDARNQDRLVSIKGLPPDLRQEFDHCPFAPRCPYVIDKCWHENPPLMPASPLHTVACWRWEEVRRQADNGVSA